MVNATSTAIVPSIRRADGGGWARIRGGAILTASVSTTRFDAETGAGTHPSWIDTMPASVRDTILRHYGSSRVANEYADLETALHWSGGAFALDAALGSRVSASDGTHAAWGRAQMTWAMTNTMALVAGGGARPSRPEEGRVGGRFVSLAMRFSTVPFLRRQLPEGVRDGASVFGLRIDRDSSRTIYVRALGARVVELMGDFTDWRAVEMRRVANDYWELTLPISAGAHRLNIRVDGASWSAPPGASVESDDFNGAVGVVIVP